MKFSDFGINAPTRLRDLIRQIRAARTAAEERSIAQKESAAIRDCFRNEDNVWRSRNVAKLLYLYLLGYPAHFGQLECLKLIASKSYTDKRIGYLGVTLLLDECQDTHLLITNSLKNDLKCDNQYITGLALSAMASVCSDQMCRDCLPDIKRLINSTNSNTRKKAIICAIRIIEKAPECAEIFTNKIKNILTEKNHSTVCSGVVLLTKMIEYQPSLQEFARKLLPNIIRILKSLLMSGYNPDYDVGGITDPFLQVALIRLIRKIGHVISQSDENVSEILAQLAGSTEATTNVSNAVLYETVLTIISPIDSDQSLRILAINILGRFLLNPDKNVRYVALGTLLQIVHRDRPAVQRHRSTIAECLNDFDISVKKRAMQLTFAITDSSNVNAMIADMHTFLSSCEPDFKGDCTSDMFECLTRYSSDKKWQIDETIEILRQGGNYIKDDLISSVISLISSAPDYYKYVCKLLFAVLTKDCSQQPLCQTACWCFGEYADKLLESMSIYKNTPSDFLNKQITESSLLELVKSILNSNDSTLITQAYALNCIMKISAKTNEDISSKVNSCIAEFQKSKYLELQTRASEYSKFFAHHDILRKDIFARMPLFVPSFVSLKIEENGNINEEKNILSVSHEEDAGQSLIELDGLKLDDNVALPAEIVSEQSDAIEKNGLLVRLYLKLTDPNVYQINVDIQNTSDNDFNDFLLQAAVPKTFKLTVLPSNSILIPAKNNVPIQQCLIVNSPSQERKPKIRLRIFYNRYDGEKITEQMDFNFS